MEYQTKQRTRLLEYLMAHPDRQYTVEELHTDIPEISISAIYRNINQLTNEGMLRRFQREGSRTFLYQYIGNRDCASHMHLRCEHCGSILHMDQETARAIAALIHQNDSFHIDIGKTILTGFCSSCN